MVGGMCGADSLTENCRSKEEVMSSNMRHHSNPRFAQPLDPHERLNQELLAFLAR
jgi:hypothetical protein